MRKEESEQRFQPHRQEPKWEVFLSVKKRDNSGEPTRDLTLAEELYEFLTQRGLRVFLSTRTLEQLGAAAYKAAIDHALDQCKILVAVGTSAEHLNSDWVRYEWDSFFNDIISGVKEDGRVFVYAEEIEVASMPRPLRQCETFGTDHEERERLYGFISNALLHSGDQTAVTRSVQPHDPPIAAEDHQTKWKPSTLLLLSSVVVILFFAASLLFVLRPYQRYRLAGTLEALRSDDGQRDGYVFSLGDEHNTGWIFLGYIDRESRLFVEGPYATVAYRATGGERGGIVPRLGDVLRVTKDRNLVIADFQTSGAANEYTAPPRMRLSIGEGDFTGETVKKDSLVIVRDLEISGVSDRPLSVWCRVAGCDDDTHGCIKAREESRLRNRPATPGD
jgi:hypothetical protein